MPMKINQPIKMIVSLGALVPHDAYLWKSSKDMRLICVNMKSKRGDVDAYGSGDEEGPSIYLSANDGTCEHDMSKQKEITSIHFPEFVGWKCFMGEISKYSLYVLMVKG